MSRLRLKVAAAVSHGLQTPGYPFQGSFFIEPGDYPLRDNYVGDRGDSFKYGLLLMFCQAELRLGIIWYRFPDPEPHATEHGNDLRYLQDSRYRQCNPALLDALTSIAALPPNERKVELIRTVGIFPTDTVFFERPLSFLQHPHFLERRLYRKDWFKDALEATKSCDVVYLDPDTGLEIKSKWAYQASDGPKYVIYDEVLAFMERGQTVVIYQNRHREPPQIIADQIRKNLWFYLDISSDIPVYYFNAGQSGRMFFILPAKRHQAQIEAALANYNASPWQQFFRRL